MSYRSKRALEKAAQLRYADGWRMDGQSQQPSRTMIGSQIATAGCLGLLVPGVGCLSIFIQQRTHPPITETWAKDPVTLQPLPGPASRSTGSTSAPATPSSPSLPGCACAPMPLSGPRYVINLDHFSGVRTEELVGPICGSRRLKPTARGPSRPHTRSDIPQPS
jgi:hypothetical protein